MTRDEIAFYSRKLEELSRKLKDLAGRYRMQNSGAYKDVKSIVEELQSRTKSDDSDDSKSESEN